MLGQKVIFEILDACFYFLRIMGLKFFFVISFYSEEKSVHPSKKIG